MPICVQWSTVVSVMLAPFKPSATLDNLLREGTATINYTDDVRVYAGCLSNRREWPTCPTQDIKGLRLKDCLTHTEVRVSTCVEDDLRPTFTCDVVHEQMHKPFHGYNRAQSAVIELAILVDRGEDTRELPIVANYVGGVWNTAPEETINVYLKEAGFEDHVAIEEKKAA